jgi:hypothetical protein
MFPPKDGHTLLEAGLVYLTVVFKCFFKVKPSCFFLPVGLSESSRELVFMCSFLRVELGFTLENSGLQFGESSARAL